MQIHEYAEIKGLEIFKIGTKETGEYTEADLDNMAAMANAGVHEAPVVISHDENQNLLEADKLPAAGWLKKVYRQGKSLFADIADVPRVVADLIQKKALRKRSVEIYNDFVDDEGKRKGKVIRRLALLGAAIPRIKSLSDHLALYEETTDQDLSVISFSEMDESIEGNLKQEEFNEKLDRLWWAFRDRTWDIYYDDEMSDDDKKKAYQDAFDEFKKLIKEAFSDTLGKFTEPKFQHLHIHSEMDESVKGKVERDEFIEQTNRIWWAFRSRLWDIYMDEELSDDDKQTEYRKAFDEFIELIQQAFDDTLGKFSEIINPNMEESTMKTDEEKIKQDAIKSYAEQFAADHGITPEEAVKQLAEVKKTATENEINAFCEDLKKKGLAPKLVDPFKELITKQAFNSFAEGETVYDELKKLMTSFAEAVADKSAYVEFKEQGKTDKPKDAGKQHQEFGEDPGRQALAEKAKKYAEEHDVDYGTALEIVSKEED